MFLGNGGFLWGVYKFSFWESNLKSIFKALNFKIQSSLSIILSGKTFYQWKTTICQWQKYFSHTFRSVSLLVYIFCHAYILLWTLNFNRFLNPLTIRRIYVRCYLRSKILEVTRFSIFVLLKFYNNPMT